MTKLKVSSSFKKIVIFLVGLLLPLSISSAVNTSQSAAVKKDFFYHIELQPTGTGSLQKITLTEDIYLHSRNRQLDDLLVLDSKGTELPFEITTPENKIVRHENEVSLYPIREPRYLLKNTNSTSFKYDQENRISEVQKTNGRDQQPQVVGYLLDLGEAKIPRNISLIFGLPYVTQTSFLRFDIDQSDNLKNWSSVSRGEVLAQLLDKEWVTPHDKIELSRIRSRYLRINLQDKSPAFLIKSVTLEYNERESIPLVWGQQKKFTYSKKEKSFIINTSPSLAYRIFQLNLPEPPSFLRGKLYSRNGEQDRWVLREHINFFHIVDGEKKIVKDRLSLTGLRATQIKIELKNLTEVQQSKGLKLKLAWVPQRLTFVANGNKPYEIVVGQSQKNSSEIGLVKQHNRKMIATIKYEMENTIKEAKFGESKMVEIIKPVLKKPVNWEKIGLWLILILGVLLMAWMAKGLLKQVE